MDDILRKHMRGMTFQQLRTMRREFEQAKNTAQSDAEEYFAISGNNEEDERFVNACAEVAKYDEDLKEINAEIERRAIEASQPQKPIPVPKKKLRRGIGSY